MFSNPTKFLFGLIGSLTLIAALIGISLFIWNISGETIGAKLNRIGIGLEILGFFSVIPEIVGENPINRLEKKFKNALPEIKSLLGKVRHFLSDEFFLVEEYIIFWPSGIIGRLIIVGNLFVSLLLISDLFLLKTPSKTVDLSSKILFYSLDITALLWIILGIVMAVALKASIEKEKVSTPLMIIAVVFFFSQAIMTIASLPLSLALGILLKICLQVSLFLFRFSLRQVIMWVTLPLVFSGNVLQLLATYF